LPANGRPHMAISVGHTMRARVTGSKANGLSVARPAAGTRYTYFVMSATVKPCAWMCL
jgi:hypothetical protein